MQLRNSRSLIRELIVVNYISKLNKLTLKITYSLAYE